MPSAALLLAATLALAVVSCGGGEDPARPAPRAVNVLFLHSDQHRGATMGCEGGRVQTPNLDRLAAEGVRFTRAYVQAPLCVPSRASLLTGTYPQLHRASNNACVLPDEALTWSEHLRARGYTTVAVGRAHGICDGFDHVPVEGKEETQRSRNLAWVERNPAWAERYEAFVGRNPDWEGGDPNLPAEETWDARIASAAIEELEGLAAAGKPFALYVGFFSPHPPYEAPPPFDEMYKAEDFALAMPDDAWIARQPVWQRDSIARTAPWVEIAGSETAQYHGLVTYLDAEVGRVLDALEQLGLAETTVVVYTSDHGAPIGDHGLMSKNLSFFEEDVRVPLIVRAPGLASAKAVDEPVEQIDVVPTMLRLLGVDVPPSFVGEDLGELMRGGSRSAKPYVFATIDLTHAARPDQRGLMLRTRRFKLNWYTNGEGELYDLEQDPGERVNLYGDAEHAETWDQHWTLLVDHLVWMWCEAPERAIAIAGGEVELHRDACTAAIRADGWELSASASGERSLRRTDESAAKDRAGDAGLALVQRSLEEQLVHAISARLGPANRAPSGGPERCKD